MESIEAAAQTGGWPPSWLAAILRLLITILLPLLLVLINARLLMSDRYILWEYNRPSFPNDLYGMSQDERIAYALPSLQYLFNNEGIEFLGDITFPDGTPIYNERELSHMADVKQVTQGISTYGYGLLALWILAAVALGVSAEGRVHLLRGLFQGGVLTVILLVVGLLVTSVSFNWLFTQFHALFFEGSTWLFPTTDTLIRLFPQRFWVDAFVLMFGGALLEALVIGGVTWWLLRR
jgi:integral membrane protein (TIGR01906 family)